MDTCAPARPPCAEDPAEVDNERYERLAAAALRSDFPLPCRRRAYIRTTSEGDPTNCRSRRPKRALDDLYTSVDAPPTAHSRSPGCAGLEMLTS